MPDAPITLFIGRARNAPRGTFRAATLAEVLTDALPREFHYLSDDGRALSIRRNGRLRRWKTRPAEFALPVKYGLRECYTLTPRDIGRILLSV